jgi:hypothetical protein
MPAETLPRASAWQQIARRAILSESVPAEWVAQGVSLQPLRTSWANSAQRRGVLCELEPVE